MTTKESRNRNSDSAYGKNLELVSMSKHKLLNYFFFSQGNLKSSKPFDMYIKYCVNLRALQKKFSSGDPVPLKGLGHGRKNSKILTSMGSSRSQ
jgi:hypothetical protein